MAKIKRAKHALRELMEQFFYIDDNGNIQWSCIEGTSVGDINRELEEFLRFRYFETPKVSNGD